MRGLEASSPTNPAAVRVAGAYGLLALIATALAFALRDGMPWEHPAPWLHLGGPAALALSLSFGVAVASGVIFATRMTVPRFAWARRLHNELRPVARDLSLGHILALAGLSSLGEELLFRGVLVPLVGVLAAGVVFGLVHQMRGPSRWVWVGWAAGVGVALGAVFALTGSLVGPLVAHAVINAVNLTFLRDHDFDDGPARSIV